MKIIQLQVENIKKIRAVSITPTGSVVQITGANGAGKSSVLDSIWWAMAGTTGITSKPVRAGEESAFIKLDLGEIVVTRKFKADGASTLVVEAADGKRLPSPQSVLDALLGSLTFDPLAFSRMSAKEQRTQLGALLGIDSKLRAFDSENAHDFALRTDKNREARALSARVDAIPVSDGPIAPVDVAALLEELRLRDEFNRTLTYTVTRIAKLKGDALSLLSEAATLRDRLARIDALVADTQGEVAKLEAEQVEADNTEPLREQIRNAQATNAEVARRAEREALVTQQIAMIDAANALTKAIDGRNAARLALIASTPMPIAGLGLEDDRVTYRGLPFDQASSAEQLRVSAAIAMASHPKLRVLRIKDGSLLDERSLGMLEAMADKEDYQLWVESVDTSGAVGVVLEDGAIVANHLGDAPIDTRIPLYDTALASPAVFTEPTINEFPELPF